MAHWTTPAHVLYQNAHHLVSPTKYRYRTLKAAAGKIVDTAVRHLSVCKQVNVMELSVRNANVPLVASIPRDYPCR